MPDRKLLAAAIAALAVCACKSAPKPFADPAGQIRPASAQVRFDPPEGQTIVEQSVTRRTHRRGAVQQVESVQATLESRFERADPGFVLTQGISALRVEHGGELVENPLVQLVTRFALRVRLATDGAFVRLENADEVEAAIVEAFPDPAEAGMVKQYFAPEALERQVRREWEGKYGGLLGREVSPGFALYEVDSIASSEGGEAHFVLERRVEGVRQREGGRELVLSLSCPLEVGKASRPEEMMRVLEEAGDPALNPSVRCIGEQVVGLGPFVPRSTALQVTAKVEGQELLMSKEIRTASVGAEGTTEAR